jgi:hypothetical protein
MPNLVEVREFLQLGSEDFEGDTPLRQQLQKMGTFLPDGLVMQPT